MGTVLGKMGVGTREPKNLMAGIITSQEKTPPEKITPAIFGALIRAWVETGAECPP